MPTVTTFKRRQRCPQSGSYCSRRAQVIESAQHFLNRSFVLHARVSMVVTRMLECVSGQEIMHLTSAYINRIVYQTMQCRPSIHEVGKRRSASSRQCLDFHHCSPSPKDSVGQWFRSCPGVIGVVPKMYTILNFIQWIHIHFDHQLFTMRVGPALHRSPSRQCCSTGLWAPAFLDRTLKERSPMMGRNLWRIPYAK